VDKIGIIGIGAMGSGIAKNLLKAGYAVTAFTRGKPSGLEHGGSTSTRQVVARELESAGATLETNLEALFSQVDTLVICVPSSKDVESILLGPGSLSEMDKARVGTVLDFSTAHPESTRKIYAVLKARGIDFLDTPMTGSVKEALAGTLRLIVGGDEPVFMRCEPLLRSVSELVLYAGSSGSGNLVKLANNFLSILDQAMTADISLVLDENGISPEVYKEFLGKSSANSGGFQLMMYRITTGDFARKFELGLALKDIGYCTDVFPSAIVDNLFSFLKKASDSGYGDKDIGTMYHYLKESR
jgi:3-hydroxyisobutyrate dehydrogenase-like beta-hydroxyacid dehydrogenase